MRTPTRRTLYCAHCDQDHKITTWGDIDREIYGDGRIIGYARTGWAYCPKRGAETIYGEVPVV